MNNILVPYIHKQEKRQSWRIDVPLDWRCMNQEGQKINPLFVNRNKGFRTYVFNQQYCFFEKGNENKVLIVTHELKLKEVKR